MATSTEDSQMAVAAYLYVGQRPITWKVPLRSALHSLDCFDTAGFQGPETKNHRLIFASQSLLSIYIYLYINTLLLRPEVAYGPHPGAAAGVRVGSKAHGVAGRALGGQLGRDDGLPADPAGRELSRGGGAVPRCTRS